MKFLALLKKELRESLPYIMIVGILLLAGGFLCVDAYVRHLPAFEPPITPGAFIPAYQLTQEHNLNGAGIWIFICAVGLGLGLGILQFWIPQLTRTWPFLLHRSAARITILCAKIMAGVLGILVTLGTLWTLLFVYACQKQAFVPVINYRILAEGWILIALGFVTYLATACAGLDAHRWYTTKLVSAAFALFMIAVVFSQWRIGAAMAVIVLTGLVLFLQASVSFQNRQF